MAIWTMRSVETRTQEAVTVAVAAPAGAPGFDDRGLDLDPGDRPSGTGARIDVLGRAATGTDAVDLVFDLMPDVLVLSTAIRDGNAREVCRDIAQWAPATRVLAVAPDDDEFLYTTVAAGATSAIVAADAPTRMVPAASNLARGESLLPPRTAKRLLNDIDDWSARSSDPLYPPPALTSTEREVLAHLGDGQPVSQIATEFGVTRHLVNVHTGYAVAKLHRFLTGAQHLAITGG